MKISRFTLRDLFWLTLVVALALGWGVYSLRVGKLQQLARENEMYRRELNALRIQLEGEGYTIVSSSIGPFLQKRTENP